MFKSFALQNFRIIPNIEEAGYQQKLLKGRFNQMKSLGMHLTISRHIPNDIASQHQIQFQITSSHGRQNMVPI